MQGLRRRGVALSRVASQWTALGAVGIVRAEQRGITMAVIPTKSRRMHSGVES
ncbi:MAG: hypothetical protein ABIS28_07220 [Caldimonas sp.]